MTHIKIHGARDKYCAWPAIARNAQGEIMVSFCSSEEHLAPQGRLVAVHSPDHGRTWKEPVTIRDSILDDRDVGLTRLRDGRILAHMRSMQHTRERYQNLASQSYEPQIIERWIERVEQPDYASATDSAGEWVSASGDGGHTWGEAGRGPTSVHGGVELASGHLLAATPPPGSAVIRVYRARADLLAWEGIADIEQPRGTASRYGEPHLAELGSGRILMMIRSTAVPYDDESPRNMLWQTYSDDAGETWAQMQPTSLWGFPPHLLVLSDGRVLCSYGHRRPPYGQRACISEDGLTWNVDHEIVLRDDAQNGDLGYPASLELAAGRILTVYYQPVSEGPAPCMRPPDPLRSKPDIQGTFWEPPG